MYLPSKEEAETIVQKNKTILIAGVLCFILAIAGAWLVCRHYDDAASAENHNVIDTVQSAERDNQRARDDIGTLQARLNVLKSNSTEQQQILIELQNQLQDCRSQLQTTQQNLTNAKSSLKQADETLQRQNQSLQILTKKIKAMEHKQAVIKRQRDTWAITVGVLFISYMAK